MLQNIGLKVSTLPELYEKMSNGLKLASVRNIEVWFGLYSVRFVNIPLFLTFRRCSVVTTIITAYFLYSKVPNRDLSISAGL